MYRAYSQARSNPLSRRLKFHYSFSRIRGDGFYYPLDQNPQSRLGFHFVFTCRKYAGAPLSDGLQGVNYASSVMDLENVIALLQIKTEKLNHLLKPLEELIIESKPHQNKERMGPGLVDRNYKRPFH